MGTYIITNNMSDTIKLTIKQTGGSSFTVNANKQGTVLDLKNVCEESSKIPADNQRLIFRGKILKEEATLES